MKAEKLLDNNFEERVLAGLLALMVVIMGIQVFSRYVLNYSLTWTEELTRYLFIWSGFLSISYCISKGISIKIDQLTEGLKAKTRVTIKVINYAIEIFFFAFLLVFTWEYFVFSIKGGYRSPALEIPIYLITAAPVISFVLAILRLIKRGLDDIGCYRRDK